MAYRWTNKDLPERWLAGVLQPSNQLSLAVKDYKWLHFDSAAIKANVNPTVHEKKIYKFISMSAAAKLHTHAEFIKELILTSWRCC